MASTSQPGSEIPTLSRNYQITLLVATGEASAELAVLTASPHISFNYKLGSTPSILLTFQGSLEEREDGALVLKYSIGGRVPEVVPPGNVPAGPGLVPPQRVEYSDESSSGAVHVTAGKEYALFQSAHRKYAIRITPAD